MSEKKLSASIEDYLETIYEQLEKSHKIKAVDIAKKMNISRASVTEALQKLAQKGYIIYEKNHPIELTEKGILIAKEVMHKHRVLCDFFTKILKIAHDEAEINACRIEHVITQTAFDKIYELVEKQNNLII
ncbi:metal-dependent transcriptional regulator [bacterium]|nr:metal-dependent transcriptional regulator [bacterium]